jgi:CheY-like chemotaxis protein
MANILVVDDDEQYPLMLAKILKKNNHDVTIARDGKEALKFCKVQQFDLIITDIFMPESDGLELLIKLTDTGLKIPVIAISGGYHICSSEFALSNALIFGAKVTLTKPFSDEQLFDAVKQCIE